MKTLALLGKDISHSKSQQMYEEILNEKIIYNLIDCKNEDHIPNLDSIFSENQGLSITAPYKKFYLSILDLDDETKELDAVNCIVNKDGRYFGYNTDFLAINDIFSKYYSHIDFVLILGNGSMSHVTTVLLKKLGVPFKVISRKLHGDLNKLDLSSFIQDYSFPLIINSCSREFVFDNSSLRSIDFFDYNYSMDSHKHLSKKFKYYDGLEMLNLQAKHALKLWGIS